jgi:hypothetical protein
MIRVDLWKKHKENELHAKLKQLQADAKTIITI